MLPKTMSVTGLDLDPATRCRHYHGPLDVVAIKMACCQTYYACIDCHRELADHPAIPWPVEALDTPAVLCGVCRHEMTIRTYVEQSECPSCGSSFNPRCSRHYPLYFTLPDAGDKKH